MLQAYSENLTTTADSPVAFNSKTVQKGCTVTMAGPSAIELNKMGVYMVHVDGVASASTTLQLYKDGVAQPQAQSTGTTLGFETLVQVPRNNSSCCCSSATTIQVMNEVAGTLENVNIVVTKVC
jgi:hypothetical protein